MILFLVRFGVLHHAFDFLFGKPRARLDGDRVFLAGGLVLGGHVQNAVGVDVEGHFNLRHAAAGRRNPFEVEFAQELVRSGHFAFALVDLDGHGGLIVFGRREDLAVLGRDRGVALDHRGHHAAERFNAEGQRRHVEKQHVVAFAREDRTLNGGADGDGFVGVDVLARFAAEEFADDFLHARHAGLTAHEDHVGDVGLRGARVGEGLAARFDRALNQIFDEAFELGARDVEVQVLRTRGVGRDVRKVDFRFLTAREFDLGLFGGVLQTLQSEDVLGEVDARVLAEFADDVVDQALVEVFAAEERVAVRGEHFKLLVAVDVRKVDDRNVERAAAQVVDGDLAVALAALVETEGQSRGGRFVDDALHFETGDAAGVLRGLTLAVVEVGRHRDHGFRDRFAEVVFGGLLHLAEHFRAHLLRSELLAVLHFDPGVAVVGARDLEGHEADVLLHFTVVEATADQTLHREERVLRVGDGLTLGGGADEDLAVVHVSDDRRRRAGAFAVFDNLDVLAFHHGDGGVRRTKVNADNLCHFCKTSCGRSCGSIPTDPQARMRKRNLARRIFFAFNPHMGTAPDFSSSGGKIFRTPSFALQKKAPN